MLVMLINYVLHHVKTAGGMADLVFCYGTWNRLIFRTPVHVLISSKPGITAVFS